MYVEGILITMTDDRTILSRTMKEQIQTQYGFQFPVYPWAVPRRIAIAESSALGMSILKYRPESDGAQIYRKLAKEVERNAQRETGKYRDPHAR